MGARLYIGLVGLFFLAIFVVFLFLPRPTYSELEKRDLEAFPKFEEHKDSLRGYTAGISDWFSNTQPFRDDILTMSMGLRNLLKLNIRSDEDAVSFIATESSEIPSTEDTEPTDNRQPTTDNLSQNLAEENAKVANAGIIVAGNPPTARAMMVFGGSEKSGAKFISAVNNYAEAFPDLNLYVVIASSPAEFYMPEKVRKRNRPETPTLDHIRQSIDPSVKFVDVHSALAAHAAEDIFLRTDHHWAPLGAFYAAQAFAKTAGVPFKGLDSYDSHTIHRFVGSMYGYSKDISVKESPEDFVYYTPRDLDYETTFITYNVNKDYQITSESKPYKSSYFKSFKDGSGMAYSTFMGGDQSLVHVKTGVESPRKLLVIKDSFGNAFPGNLFYSFSDIHVVDFRYFNKNLPQYVRDNGITDIALVFNIFNVCNSSTFSKVNRFLTQQPSDFRTTDNGQPTTTETPPDTISPNSPSSPSSPSSPISPNSPNSPISPISPDSLPSPL